MKDQMNIPPASQPVALADKEISGAEMHDVVHQLREYASNPGYSHNDYADTMCQAANCIESLRAMFWNCAVVPSDAKGKADAAIAGGKAIEPLTDVLLDRIARNYFAEEYAQQHVKNAIHDAFVEANPSPATSAADAKDAARYRWLRNEAWGGHVMRYKFPHVVEYGPGMMRSGVTELAEEALDNAIDAAIAAMAAVPSSEKGGA